MNIVLIEDEIKTAQALALLISTVEPGATIIDTLQSVQEAIDYFNDGNEPDLIFMDVQLADGLCFDIFKEVTVPAPVIFCTAFDEYAIEGFRANGIDYLLKPFTEASLQAAFDKFRTLRNFFQINTENESQLEKLLQLQPVAGGKKNFLVFKHNKYSIIPVQQIAFIYIKHELPVLHTFDDREYTLSQSLDTIHTQLPAGQFYRINRQYLINFEAVQEVEPYFARKLIVRLKTTTPDPLIINKNKTMLFLNWLDSR